MGFFRRSKGDRGQSAQELAKQQQRAQQTVAALERGQIPQYVKERIANQTDRNYPWTSDLSVNEWLLLKQYGLKPLGMVMGSSIYHIGYSAASYGGSWGSGSIPVIEQALLEGRRLALKRMQQEAELMGAHAVVGVRLNHHLPDVSSHETEFTAFGTAVVLDGQAAPAEPLLCTVSGAEFVKLINAGSVPMSVGLGVSAYYQYTTRQDQWASNGWSNREISTFTESVYATRHYAMQKLMQQVREHGGNGVLAHETALHVHEVEVERGEDDERTDHILEFVAMGTIVSSVREQVYPNVESVLSLSSKSRARVTE
ncbi:heavy metal-binding domain-containing protein [Alicyclobacillus mengziensis]|uniref:Heavy metal-binding domain-containing protein n=1 Tax=Alicyclobacillus mengziensis TaxID=2931921 RepID=A0A9X7W1U4_9BACL|nr:heavy metal-binding domain-containing protein [Alicyclobacillus mengziensis]QSO47768.1 heavy metal-binding domain-containing protein [Alicyclobacillus mengziensis]